MEPEARRGEGGAREAGGAEVGGGSAAQLPGDLWQPGVAGRPDWEETGGLQLRVSGCVGPPAQGLKQGSSLARLAPPCRVETWPR